MTPEHLQPDGRLQLGGSLQSAFSTITVPTPRQAVQVAAVLAAQPEGALEDAAEFPPDVGAVHLHLRADGLGTAREVVYRWIYDTRPVEIPGVLAPTTTLTLAASHPIAPQQTGKWRVEVISVEEDEAATVLLAREFLVQRSPS